jgi:hypothetical protein
MLPTTNKKLDKEVSRKEMGIVYDTIKKLSFYNNFNIDNIRVYKNDNKLDEIKKYLEKTIFFIYDMSLFDMTYEVAEDKERRNIDKFIDLINQPENMIHLLCTSMTDFVIENIDRSVKYIESKVEKFSTIVCFDMYFFFYYLKIKNNILKREYPSVIRMIPKKIGYIEKHIEKGFIKKYIKYIEKICRDVFERLVKKEKICIPFFYSINENDILMIYCFTMAYNNYCYKKYKKLYSLKNINIISINWRQQKIEDLEKDIKELNITMNITMNIKDYNIKFYKYNKFGLGANSDFFGNDYIKQSQPELKYKITEKEKVYYSLLYMYILDKYLLK